MYKKFVFKMIINEIERTFGYECACKAALPGNIVISEDSDDFCISFAFQTIFEDLWVTGGLFNTGACRWSKNHQYEVMKEYYSHFL